MQKSLKQKEHERKEKRENKVKTKLQEIAKSKLSLVGVLAVTIIICIGLLLSNFHKMPHQLNPEIARSMTYDQVQEGDEKIERYRLCKV